jgi:L-alanine-DL-glutamate epimerase-like enolase superfamily enzyme
MKIINAERLALNIPFANARVTRAMHRANSHGERVYLYRVETDNGIIGYGEHGYVADPQRVIGQNPLAIVNDDSIGFGLQMAVLDALGKDAGEPIHALLGPQVRKRCPISWWSIDMPPRDWAAEAKESVKRGYTCFKLKARPWWDILAQVEAIEKVVPADYKLDIDFNGLLVNCAAAQVMLRKLDPYRNVGMYESPFYLFNDFDAARLLKQKVEKPLIEHWNEDLLHARACDGFVLAGTVNWLRNTDALIASFQKAYWLQLNGTGLVTAYGMHLGSVLSRAQLPYITCHEHFKNDLLKKPLEVKDGYIDVPDGPGLGVEVDEKAIERFTVDADAPVPRNVYRQKKRIIKISWPGAGKKRSLEFTDENAYYEEYRSGNLTGFHPGIGLTVQEDDGSAAFKKHHGKLLEGEK